MKHLCMVHLEVSYWVGIHVASSHSGPGSLGPGRGAAAGGGAACSMEDEDCHHGLVTYLTKITPRFII